VDAQPELIAYQEGQQTQVFQENFWDSLIKTVKLYQ